MVEDTGPHILHYRLSIQIFHMVVITRETRSKNLICGIDVFLINSSSINFNYT